MKVYTSVRYRWIDGEFRKIAEKSYEYNGDIAECKGDTNVEAPKPTAQEIAIQKQQLAMMQKAQTSADERAAFEKQLMPVLLKGSGYTMRNGNLVKSGLSQEEIRTREQEAQRQEFEPFLLESMGLMRDGKGSIIKSPLSEKDQLIEDQMMAVLKGELPIGAGIQDRLTDQKTALSERMTRQLGTNWEGSTAGIQALQEFDTGKNILEDEIRFGRLSGLDALRATEAGIDNQGFRSLDYLSDKPVQSNSILPQGLGITADMLGGGVGQYSGLSSGYGSLLQPYQQQRGMEYQAGAQNAANKAASQSGFAGILGTLGGAGLTMFSSKDFKKNIKDMDTKEALELVQNMKSKKWTYKGDDAEHIGVIAEEAPKEVQTLKGKAVHVGDEVGILIGAVQELAKKVA